MSRSELLHGDCLEVLRTLAPESVDACVTDPPYGIGFMGKEWDTFKPGQEAKRIVENKQIASDNPNLKGRTRGPASSPSAVEYDRTLAGQEGFQAWTKQWASAVYRVLKPGAYIVVCGAPRSHHRMMSGLEEAGFEIRDAMLFWGFGQGFPKSLNVSNDERFCQCGQAPNTRLEAALMSGLRRRVDATDAVSSEPQQDVLVDVREAPSQLAEAASAPRGAERSVRGMREAVPLSAESSGASVSGDVFAAVQREDALSDTEAAPIHSAEGLHAASRSEVWASECSVEGRHHVQAEQGQLHRPEVRAVSPRVSGDGAVGWVCDGASADRGAANGPVPDAHGSRASYRSRHQEQSSNESGTLADEPDAQTGGRWPRCGRCGKSVVPDGLGTALKPAYEPIAIARKPFRGSVAGNVEAHGTGALNIDACRIEYQDEADYEAAKGGDSGSASRVLDGYGHTNTRPQSEKITELGRWPANVVLDDLAALVLDEQSGECSVNPSGTFAERPTTKNEVYSGAYGPAEVFGYGDSGGASRFFKTVELTDDDLCRHTVADRATDASVECCLPAGHVGGHDYSDIGGARFLYCAKPSREERDMGCYDLRERSGGEATARTDGTAGLNNPRAGAGRTGGARNFHPTVKPIELMRWLVRLVTPINGTVIDPFMGSGTTGIACRYELRSFIGIEREAEYLEIARRRIDASVPLFSESA